MFVPIAQSPNIVGVILGRLISGISASTGSTLVGGSIADIYDDKERGVPMSIFSMSALQGEIRLFNKYDVNINFIE